MTQTSPKPIPAQATTQRTGTLEHTASIIIPAGFIVSPGKAEPGESGQLQGHPGAVSELFMVLVQRMECFSLRDKCHTSALRACHSAYEEVSQQLVGVISLLPPCRSQGGNGSSGFTASSFSCRANTLTQPLVRLLFRSEVVQDIKILLRFILCV